MNILRPVCAAETHTLRVEDGRLVMVVRAIGVLVGVVALFLGLLVAGMRWKFSPVLDTVRRLNRSVTNPRVMRTAGSAQSQTAVIEHRGRTSGRTYQTPVDTISTPTGFLIALPYGTRADWVRNLLAAGSGTVIEDGRRVGVGLPTIVATADVTDLIPDRTLRTLRLFGVTDCLRLERAETPA
jgi:deazaflavin-dependent oxidoreductase (nitroreductase family)